MEEATDDVISEVSPFEDNASEHVDREPAGRTGESAIEAGDSFTG